MDTFSEPKIFTTCSHVIQNVIYPILLINKLFPFQQQRKIYSRCFCKDKLFTPVEQNKSGTCCIEKEADQRKRRNILTHSQKTAARLQQHYIILTSLVQQIIPTALLNFKTLYESTISKVEGLAPNFEFEFPNAQPSLNSVNCGRGCSGDHLVLAERKERPEHMTLSTRQISLTHPHLTGSI